MELIALGGGGAFPTLSQPCSSYLVRLDGFSLLLDAGYATFQALLRHTAAEAIDAVIVTHGHPDHCADLHPLLRARALGGGHPPVLPLYCPPGALDAVLALDRPGMLDASYDLREFSPGDTLHIGPFTVGTRPLPHSRPNAGLRVSCGRSTIVYTGDTGPSDTIIELARSADILIADASFPEHVPDGLAGELGSAALAGRYAAAAGVGRLVLSHLMPGVDETESLNAARRHFDGEILLPSQLQDGSSQL